MDLTVRGMKEATRRRAEAAAAVAGLPLAAWLNRAILENAATHVPPPVWAARDAAASETDDDDSGDDADLTLAHPAAQEQIQHALDALDARLERTSRNIAGAVIPITRKIEAIADRVVANDDDASAPSGLPVVAAQNLTFVIPPNRAYRRGLGLIGGALLMLSLAGAGGLVWLWFDMQEPPANPLAKAAMNEGRQTLSPAARAAMRPQASAPGVAEIALPAAADGVPAEFADLDRMIAQSRPDDRAADPALAVPADEDAAPSAQLVQTPAALDGTPAEAGLEGDAKLLAQLRDGAAKNDAMAQHDLALLMMEGRLLPRDERAAGELFESAALQGVPNAQYNLGVIYDNGIGRAADDTMAYFWYSAAADQGHVAAQYNLGVAAAQGKGAPRDYAVAALWFERAARGGLPDAQFNLAQMYESGIGLPRDAERALELYAAADAQGYPPARQRMIALEGRIAARPAPATAPMASPPRAATPPTPGSAAFGRSDIVELQTLLRKLELLKSNADGLLGPGTRAAIRQYQSMAGLTPTGEPSRELLLELRDVAKP
jgi:TPR repeat protein